MRHIISILVDNEPGVLARIAGLFTARGFNIETEIVSGISSYAGIAAQHQIPLTKRATHESFWVVTGHTHSGKVSSDIALAAQSSATVVVLMGMRFLEEIVDTFKQYNTGHYPVAVVQNGTTPAEKALVSNLDNIINQVSLFEISNPAVLIFGWAVTDGVTEFKNLINKEAIAL